ncbi:MAG: cell division protein FtsL [Acidobacteriota bacterium]
MTEIYIVKQIDNSRLIKEVDYERTKQCLFLLTLGLFCLLIFLVLAWQHFRVLRYGYEGETLRRELNQLVEVNRQLKLERATLRSPQRIDLIAKRKLGFQAPGYEQVIVLAKPFVAEPDTILVARSERVGRRDLRSALPR